VHLCHNRPLLAGVAYSVLVDIRLVGVVDVGTVVPEVRDAVVVAGRAAEGVVLGGGGGRRGRRPPYTKRDSARSCSFQSGRRAIRDAGSPRGGSWWSPAGPLVCSGFLRGARRRGRRRVAATLKGKCVDRRCCKQNQRDLQSRSFGSSSPSHHLISAPRRSAGSWEQAYPLAAPGTESSAAA